MSADAARWYDVSIHGRGFINANGSRTTIACIANGLPHDASTLWAAAGRRSRTTGGFGGAQVMSLSPVPVFGPGDGIYACCVMNPLTAIFTYGWN